MERTQEYMNKVNAKENIITIIKDGNDPEFVYNQDKERVECRCGHPAVWWGDGFVCGTITAYPCDYSMKRKVFKPKTPDINDVLQTLKDRQTEFENPGTYMEEEWYTKCKAKAEAFEEAVGIVQDFINKSK
jgi:hypothetical protein